MESTSQFISQASSHTRALHLKNRAVELVLHVFVENWDLAEYVFPKFESSLISESENAETEMELLLLFMEALATTSVNSSIKRERTSMSVSAFSDPEIKEDSKLGKTYSPRSQFSIESTLFVPFLSWLLEQFDAKFLQSRNPVVVFPGLLRRFAISEALNIYYDVVQVLRSKGKVLPKRITPSLLERGRKKQAKLVATFGGQGITDDLVQEIEEIYKTYTPIIKTFFEKMVKTLLDASRERFATEYVPQGLDIMRWIAMPLEDRPPRDYIITAPVSFPLIALIQLCNYYILAKITDMTISELRSCFSYACGHSQGIAVAAVIAASDNDEAFHRNASNILIFLFRLGVRAQQAFPITAWSPSLAQQSLENQEGVPSPMLAVSGLTYEQLKAKIDKNNVHLPAGQQIEIALKNGPTKFVCAGTVTVLCGLCKSLRRIQLSSSEDQSKIPFSSRKLRFKKTFLPIAAPFHSSYLKTATDLLVRDVSELKLGLYIDNNAIPIISDKYDDILGKDGKVYERLARSVLEQSVDWPAHFFNLSYSNVLDFGPGGISGVGSLSLSSIEGRGIQVYLANSLSQGIKSIKSMYDLLGSHADSDLCSWENMYKPQLLRTKQDGKLRINTKFSRLLGKPPIMVAGMTPCTVNSDFVSACINAGYHVELAGGGHHSERSLRTTIDEILHSVAPGQGITINTLFINQKQWGFQFPLVQVLRKEGYPIEGFDIAAGVPSTELASEILNALFSAGLRHVSFKPGSIESIRQVINIARVNPYANIILQWTGGRAGGHHSYEDFHQPILETYSAIRSQHNIYLVAGSGFGDAEGMYPYFTGEWSLSYGVPKMPFDGVLMGSRLMVAKECLTSSAVKEAIVRTPGVDDEKDWVKSYKVPAGGIITTKSELGEPIHMLANRGVMLWKELDDNVFSLPKAKRGEALLKRKEYWIARINRDFQKVWFGKSFELNKPCDLNEMTYYEVAKRVVELLFIEKQNRWIHSTHFDMFVKYLKRVEERFATVTKPSILPFVLKSDSPHVILEEFFNNISEARSQSINSEDCIFFVKLCQTPGQKPVPFIPIMNDDFETWFKKDSLWQSEDLDAVVDNDPDRVCVLQGPVAVKHSQVADEPVATILDTINDTLVSKILAEYYDGDESKVPVVEYAGLDDVASGVQPAQFSEMQNEFEIVRTIERAPPSHHALVYALSFSKKDWIHALLGSDYVVFGHKLRRNPFKNIFSYHEGATIKSYRTIKEINPTNIELYDEGKLTCRAAIGANDIIDVEMIYNFKSTLPTLRLKYAYRPMVPYYPIHEVRDDYTKLVKQFYWDLWIGDSSNDSFDNTFESDPREAVYTCNEYINQLDASNFCKVIGNNSPAYVERATSAATAVPMDFAIVVCWRALIQPLFSKRIDGDILRLVHLSNSIAPINMSDGINNGDFISTRAYVSSIVNEQTGKTVEVKAVASKNGVELFELTSKFFYRGKYSDYENCFVRRENPVVRVELKTNIDLELFLSKKWLHLNEAKERLKEGSVVKFTTNYYGEPAPKPALYKKLRVQGQVWLQLWPEEFELLGSVDFSSEGDLFADPVLTYLNKYGRTIYDSSFFPDDGYVLYPSSQSPEPIVLPTNPSNALYSNVSGDHNPVHTIPIFAEFAELPGTITHGMWTSAAVRALVETYVAENRHDRMRSYQATFLDMVLPGQKLNVVIRHVGMRGGAMICKVEVFNTSEVKVLEAEAVVEGPTTAYVFTGQGSQEAGMGMDLYKSSPVAKAIWDEAEDHMLKQYGVSILEIVQRNPTTKTVYFRGPKGIQIRANYMSLTYDSVNDDGQIEALPLFPTINEESDSFTFYHPDGLLHATQFSQPAITIMEKAAFDDMVEQKLVNRNSSFAGHSLGEYAALASFARIFTVRNLVDIVFYRGMTMQNAVRRDKQGRSSYGMMAVSPNRIGGGFNDKLLKYVIVYIAKATKRLLEIVNFNIENQQYVAAGHLVALNVLGKALTIVDARKAEIMPLFARGDYSMFEHIVAVEAAASEELLSKQGHITLTRGTATIPLPGVDVPFHSSFLLSGVMPFRSCLMKSLQVDSVDIQLLKKKYIPNLVARPFDTTKEYVELVYKSSSSPELLAILNDWDHGAYESPAKQQALGHKLLIELLAYQFASPVRWIETQDYLFGELRVELLVEIGPSFTLGNIAERTIKSKYEASDDALMSQRRIWGVVKNKAEIYYERSGESASSPATTNKAKAAESKPAAPAAPVPAPAPVVAAAPVAAAAAPRATTKVDTLTLPTSTLLQIVLAVKLKVPVDDIPLSKSIKDFANGKSTLQNELIADLQKEFGDNVPEKAEELPLSELGSMIGNRTPGKLISQYVNKMFAGKMPAGFSISSAKALLDRDYGVSSAAADFVLAYCSGREPPSRLTDEGQVSAWIGECTQKVFALNNITFSAAGSSASSAGGSVVSSAEVEKITARQNDLVRLQIDLLSSYLGQNPQALLSKLKEKDEEISKLQNEIDFWLSEHGQAYSEGIRPIFSSLKVRTYDSWWNWGVQDVVELYLNILLGNVKSIDNFVMSKSLQAVNRGDENLIHMLHRLIDYITEDMAQKFEYRLAKTFIQDLLVNVEATINSPPVFKNITPITAPSVNITDDGNMIYSEVPRESIDSYDAFVHEMKRGVKTSENSVPYIYIKRRSEIDPSEWVFSDTNTNMYFESLHEMAQGGVTFEGKYGLMTGCGKGSIGAEVLKGLLSGGANIIVTTSTFNRSTNEYFRSIYESFGAKGSSLVVVPFNQGSVEDGKNLIEYIYGSSAQSKGLGWDLDFIVPFAAISENGRDITEIDSKSELAHRLMLTNVLRLIGLVASKKKSLGIATRPAQVILPLSPNHGDFGHDGLYGESKIALETLLNKWFSESWSDYISVVGAVIGWTRGTGLMSDNNVIAAEIENQGMRTFSTLEMAFIVLGLMHPRLFKQSQFEPIWADLAGGMNRVANLHQLTNSIRMNLKRISSVKRALFEESKVEHQALKGPVKTIEPVKPRANLKFEFNPVKPYSDAAVNKALAELISLEQTIVVAGFGEVGPWGNTRTRWEIESKGEFSIEGCISMAWMMGLIRFHNGRLPSNNQVYVGWVDSASGEPVSDYDVKAKYEEKILKHSGIRIVEPELWNGYDPDKKVFYREVSIEHDMTPIEVSKEEAEHFARQHGSKVDVFQSTESGAWMIKFKKGTTIYIPKALKFDRFVAGQIPTGWDAARYGVPKEMIGQVDRSTLYVLVATVEALINAGITDPYEFYEYVHVTEVGNTSGGGAGGQDAQHGFHFDRYFEKPVQSDILQEFFINTMPAWVNLLMLSSSGPIKTPVGACATAVESVDIGVETILSGKARVVLVGGYDGISPESSYEFASMKATSNAETETAAGRDPREMSRPTSSSRAGFMESEGAGIQVLMTAALAIQMGCPIYGIVAFSGTATDKEGRSIPAPGQGILTTARKVNDIIKPRNLDVNYRARQLKLARENIQNWAKSELEEIAQQVAAKAISCEEAAALSGDVEMEAQKRLESERRLWGHTFYLQDPRISPLEGALATFGLTVNDIGVVSFHGTGTKANDYNESSVVDKQMRHLGRTFGRPLPCVFQKHLTGHPKGAAAAWMLNGALQIINTSTIPGNRNADNIDPSLRKFTHLHFPSRSLLTRGVKAALIKSFGFGQVGGEVLLVHPDYIMTTLSKDVFESYMQRRRRREIKASRYTYDSMLNNPNQTMIRPKTSPPYPDDLESSVYLNPLARAEFDVHVGSWIFDKPSLERGLDEASQLRRTVKQMAESVITQTNNAAGATMSSGVDVQVIAELNTENQHFLERNFTDDEIKYCQSQPDVRSSFAGRWAGKESVVKALHSAVSNGAKLRGSLPNGAALPLNEIEILPEHKGMRSGLPKVVLRGSLAELCASLESIQVSISHSGEYAVAIAQITHI